MRNRLAVLVLLAVSASGHQSVLNAGPASAAPVVTNEAGYRQLWGHNSQTGFILGADIALRNCRVGIAKRNSATALTVIGNGHTIRQTCKRRGVLEQQGTGPLTFDGVTITGGDNRPAGPPGLGSGGGIRDVKGPVTLKNSTVSGNYSSGSGGGVAAIGGVSVGGASAMGSVTLMNSTVSGNTSGGAGGGMWGAGLVNVTNSTVSGNRSKGGAGGGISSSVAVKLRHATVVGNSAPTGANLDHSFPFSALTSFASVVALPTGGGQNCLVGSLPAPLGFSPTYSNGFNFSSDASCNFTAPGDIQNGGNPNLGPLVNNGGATMTRLPFWYSLLVDAIPLLSCGEPRDQRGITRPQLVRCDIGAVELETPPA